MSLTPEEERIGWNELCRMHEAAERDLAEAREEIERLRVSLVHERDARASWVKKAEEKQAHAARLAEALRRALYIAEHLFQMVPQQVWRDSGGDDIQGHYEGDYHAEKVREELAALREYDERRA